MQKILVASDFSDPCRHAIHYVNQMVEGTSIKIDLVNVFDVPIDVTHQLPARAIQGLIDEKKIAVKRLLVEQMDEISLASRGICEVIFGSSPAREISGLATHGGYHLVVTALRKKYTLYDRIIGTVTAQVIRSSEVPVLAIPLGAAYSDLREIVFPTVMSSAQEVTQAEQDALKWLSNFSSMFRFSSVHLIHIVPDTPDEYVEVTYQEQPWPNLDFTQAAAKTVEEGVTRFSQREKAGMLALYKPHRNFWKNLFHHSVTKHLLLQTKIPILVFR